MLAAVVDVVAVHDATWEADTFLFLVVRIQPAEWKFYAFNT
jgi:hypothetical protein